MTPQRESPALRTFLEAFVGQSEDLRGLSSLDWTRDAARGDWAVDEATEVKRVFRLVDDAARKHALWIFENSKDDAHDKARSYLHQITEIHDHDSAHHAEGLLQAARRRDMIGDTFSRMVLGQAREAATHAAQIDQDLEGVDNSEGILGAACAAGQTLAGAGVVAGKEEEAVAEAIATAERLR